MGAKFTKGQSEKLTIIENRVKLRPTKQEIQDRLELEKLQEKAKKAVSPPKKRLKYGNKKVIVDGQKFDSKKEAARYRDLVLLQKAGEIHWLQTQVTYDFIHNGVKIASYVADFVYLNGDGKTVVEDVKGFKGGSAYAIFRLKKKMMKAFFEIEITET